MLDILARASLLNKLVVTLGALPKLTNVMCQGCLHNSVTSRKPQTIKFTECYKFF